MSVQKPILSESNGRFVLSGVGKHEADFTTSLGRWDKRNRRWTFPMLYCCLEDIRAAVPDLEYESLVAETMDTYEAGFKYKYWADYDIASERWHDLYEFQQDAVFYFLHHPYKNAILGLSPGLGKTATALVAAQELSIESNIVVVCPKILIPTWLAEIEKWSDYTAYNAWQREPDWTYSINVVNYESLHKYSKNYALHEPQLLIVDESIMVKSLRGGTGKGSQRAKNVYHIAGHSDRVWLLSGAPAAKDASDLFGQFRIMYPRVFMSFWKFAERHCVIEKNVWNTRGQYGGTILGTKRGIDLRSRFRDLMFMRTMDEVADFLPDYITVDMPLVMGEEQERLYVQAKQRVLEVVDFNEVNREAVISTTAANYGPTEPKTAYTEDEFRAFYFRRIMTGLEQMIRLQQTVSNPIAYGGQNVSVKHDAIVQLLQNKTYETPMLIWSFWKAGGVALAERINKECPDITAAVVNGDTKNPETWIEQYKAGNIDVLVLSLAMGKYGLTLTDTRTIIAMDRYWDGDMMYQASFRTRRLGMTHAPVWVNMYVPGTIDEYVMRNIESKYHTISSVTGADFEQMIGTIGGSHEQ